MPHDINPFYNLNRAALDLIIGAYQAGDHEALDQLGLSTTTAQALCEMQTRCYLALSQFRGGVISFRPNQERLDLLIKHLQQETRQDVMINRLLSLGASYPMLAQLAGVDRTDFQCRCKLLGIDADMTRGRPKDLSEQEAAQLDTAQSRLGNNPVTLDRFAQLADATGIRLSRIWYYLERQHAEPMID